MEKKESFLIHSANGQFAVFIESQVAKYYGFKTAGMAGVVLKEGALNFRFQSITIIGQPHARAGCVSSPSLLTIL